MAWLSETEGVYELKYLCTVPKKRQEEVEEALLSLALDYCKGKGAKKVLVRFDEAPLKKYNEDILLKVLVEKF